MNGHRGFTLVEVIVAIGIIVLLAGLSLSIATKVVEASEIRRTEATLSLLDQAVKQWEIDAGRKLTWWDVYDPEEYHARADVHGDTPPVLIITEMLAVIGRSPASRQALAQIDPALVVRYERGSSPPWIDTPRELWFIESMLDSASAAVGGEAMTVVDAWGTPIYATHPGRPHDPRLYHEELVYRAAPDPDGTIRTYNEREYGIAPNRQVVFVSAGPDMRFGLHEEFGDLGDAERAQAMDRARRDNLFTANVTFE